MNHPNSKPRPKFYHLRMPERINLDTFLCQAQVPKDIVPGWVTVTDQSLHAAAKGELVSFINAELTANPEEYLVANDGTVSFLMTYQEDLEYEGYLIIPARVPELTLPNGMENAAAKLHYGDFEE